MLNRLFARRATLETEPELDLVAREHEGECAILVGLERFYGPLPPLPPPIPKPIRKRPKRFKRQPRPIVDLD